MPQTNVRTYKTSTGTIPFGRWLSKLRDRRAIAKVVSRVERMELENFGDHKSVGGGVQETRINYGPGY